MRAEYDAADVDREEQLAALEQRLSRRRNYLTKGSDRGFDEDDEFWVRGLGNWAEEQDAADARGRSRARRRAVQGDRAQGHDRGREEDPRARAHDRHPRRPAAAAARARERRPDGDGDHEGARAAAQGAEEGHGLEEGRRHEAHQPRARRPARRRRAQRGGRRARRRRRHEEARVRRASSARACSARS